VGRDLAKLRTAAAEVLKTNTGGKRTKTVPLWDGHAAERIAQIIVRGSTV
jgi:hypothetical protein